LYSDELFVPYHDQSLIRKNFQEGYERGGNYARRDLLDILLRVEPGLENLPPAEGGLGYNLPLDDDALWEKIKDDKLLVLHVKASNGIPARIVVFDWLYLVSFTIAKFYGHVITPTV